MSALRPSRGRVVGPEAVPQALGGLLAVAVWLRLTILRLAVVASVSAAVIACALLRHGFPSEPGLACSPCSASAWPSRRRSSC